MSRPGRGTLLVGAALLVAHAGLAAALLTRSTDADLAVLLKPVPIGGTWFPPGVPAPGSPVRTRLELDGKTPPPPGAPMAPGLRRAGWVARFRGGHDARVATTILAGPVAPPRLRWCGVRLKIGPRFLDDGAAGPGTVAHAARAALDERLKGVKGPLVGAFTGVTALAMAWSDERGGALVADVSLGFKTGKATIHLIVVPHLVDGRMVLDPEFETKISLRGVRKAVEWLFDDTVDRVATERVQREVSPVVEELARLLDASTTLPVGDAALDLALCDEDPIHIDAGGATLALAVRVDEEIPGPVVPPRGIVPAPPMTTALAIEADLGAANVLLHALWSKGRLEERLAAIARRWLEATPAARDALALRVRSPAFVIPPTAEVLDGRLALGAELALDLLDGAATTPARAFVRTSIDPAGAPGGHVVLAPRVEELSLTCQPIPGRLEPCYQALVELARAEAPAVAERLATTLADELDRLTRGRVLRARGGGPPLAIDGVAVSWWRDGASAWVRLGVDARLETP